MAETDSPDTTVADASASDAAAVAPRTAGVPPAHLEGRGGGRRSPDEFAPRTAAAGAITVFVCITCRSGRALDVVPVPGEMLAAATARAAEGTGIAVRPIRCLANCNRGLSAAVRRDGGWTYVFGDLDPVAGAEALIAGAKLFAGAADGLMPWRGRPDALKRGLVARTPPFDFAGDCR